MDRISCLSVVNKFTIIKVFDLADFQSYFGMSNNNSMNYLTTIYRSEPFSNSVYMYELIIRPIHISEFKTFVRSITNSQF